MSTISQTSPVRRAPLRTFWPLAVVTVVIAAALAPSARRLVALGLQAHWPAPDLALLGALPPAIKIHLAAALLALALGGGLMIVRKGRTFHRTAGWAWAALVALTAGSSLFITTLRPGHFSLLHLLTGWVLIILPLAVLWARRHSVAAHRRAMMGLFYGGFAFNLIIAFIPGRTLWQIFFS